MNWKKNLISIIFFFLITIIIVSSQQPSSLLAEINHISFSENHIFYLSKEGNHFGFMSRQSGQIMTSYKMQEHETIISVDKSSDSVILRSGRNKIVLFDIRSSHLQEITVRITFNHQQIIDAAKVKGKYYVLTDKDLRVYDQNQQRMDESLKNIITSGRKNQFFKRFFLNDEESVEDMVIVLLKNGQVCLRTFKKVKRGVDQCYFKIPYDITAIDRINNTILIQTNTVNYVITQHTQSSYSFDGKVAQINGDFIQLSNHKTYDLKNQVFVDGIIVEGSRIDEIFWIHPSGDNQMSIFFNSIFVKQMVILPKRSWFTKGKVQDTYDLLFEFEENRFEMYQVSIKDDNLLNFSSKWINKSLKYTEIPSQL